MAWRFFSLFDWIAKFWHRINIKLFHSQATIPLLFDHETQHSTYTNVSLGSKYTENKNPRLERGDGEKVKQIVAEQKKFCGRRRSRIYTKIRPGLKM